MSPRFLPIIALVFLTFAGSTISAQTPPPAAPSPSPSPAPRHSVDQAERHINQLHSALKITAAQTASWEAFAKVMRDNARHMDGLYKGRAQVFGTMNAVDSLKSYEQIAEAHLQDLQKLEPAFEALYNTMDDRQKRTADRLFRTSPGK